MSSQTFSTAVEKREPLVFHSLPRPLRRLYMMLQYKRPHGSLHETKFIDAFILKALPEATLDAKGNIWFKQDETPILWSSHTDTVHTKSGIQALNVHKIGPDIFIEANKSNCLGADDTTGVWLMLNMIKAKVGGTYVFHRGEEKGCIGSKWVATTTDLSRFKFAIAFDRRDYKDVITHQCGIRTCSDEFALSFIAATGLKMIPCDGGVFTDTNSYKTLIPECTNISVGYSGAHSACESQNMTFAWDLLQKLIKTDWSKLVCARDMTKVESKYSYGGDNGYSYGGYGGYYNGYSGKKSQNTMSFDDKFGRVYVDPENEADVNDMYSLVWEEAFNTAAFLVSYGFTEQDVRDFIKSNKPAPKTKIIDLTTKEPKQLPAPLDEQLEPTKTATLHEMTDNEWSKFEKEMYGEE